MNLKRSYLGQEAVWADNSKKFYNQVGYEESFELGFGFGKKYYIIIFKCFFIYWF